MESLNPHSHHNPAENKKKMNFAAVLTSVESFTSGLGGDAGRRLSGGAGGG